MITVDGYCTLGIDREYDLDADGLLRAMDEAGVEKAVIAPTDRALAVKNREGNDAMLAHAQAHPDRFIPACCATPWLGDEGAAELDRALTEGARMVVFHPAVQGFQANDELIHPLIETVRPHGAPVYIHTGPPGLATPWQLADLAEAFPTINFIMGHCGSTDYWNDVIPVMETVSNIYLESSLARPLAIRAYAEALGDDRTLVGSGAPLSEFVFEWTQLRAEAPPDLFPRMYGETMMTLLAGGDA